MKRSLYSFELYDDRQVDEPIPQVEPLVSENVVTYQYMGFYCAL